MDKAFALKQLGVNAWKKQKVCKKFIDLEKTYNRVNKQAL